MSSIEKQGKQDLTVKVGSELINFDLIILIFANSPSQLLFFAKFANCHSNPTFVQIVVPDMPNVVADDFCLPMGDKHLCNQSLQIIFRELDGTDF